MSINGSNVTLRARSNISLDVAVLLPETATPSLRTAVALGTTAVLVTATALIVVLFVR